MTLSIASDGRYARVARTVVASCASLRGFSVDDLGDVRLLVDTAFHAFAEIAAGPVEIRVRSGAHEVHVEMSVRRDGDRRLSEPDARILETVAAVIGSARELVEAGQQLTLRVTLRAFDEETGPETSSRDER